MIAGPDLDRLVAESVMGWKTEKEDVTVQWEGKEIVYRTRWWINADGAMVRPIEWSPSKYIHEAWEVVAHLGDRYGTTVNGPFILSMHDHNGTWFASFGKHHSPESATAPQAICLAALSALGIPCP